MGSSHPILYNDSNTPLIHRLNWLKDIPDQTRISQMTIPGTHDSCSLFGICCARTQTWTLTEQLNAGIRFLDIRLRRINNILRAYHAFIDQKENFDNILRYLIGFLDRNPTEFIIVEINSEHTPLNSTMSFDELYQRYTLNYKNRIVEYDNKDLTVGELRGKLYILKIFEGSLSGTQGVFLQNKWSINFKWYINVKKRKIKEFFNRVTRLGINNENNTFISKNDNDKKNMYVTFISCSSDYAMMTPYSAAIKLNPLVMEYNGRMGIVCMDYPGEDLITHLIDQNNVRRESKREKILEGDKIYLIHNDTQKYLFLDANNLYLNHYYCSKEAQELVIKHKNQNEGKEFKNGDEIILETLLGYQVEFKIDEIFLGNSDCLTEETLFMLQVKINEGYQYIKCSFDNKDSDRHYLFDFSAEKKNDDFSYYYFITKAPKGLNNII